MRSSNSGERKSQGLRFPSEAAGGILTPRRSSPSLLACPRRRHSTTQAAAFYYQDLAPCQPNSCDLTLCEKRKFQKGVC